MRKAEADQAPKGATKPAMAKELAALKASHEAATGKPWSAPEKPGQSKAVPLGVNTLKNSLAIGIGIHVILSAYTAVYLSRQLSKRRTQFLLLCYFFLAYAGFESVFIFTQPGAQLEWWTRWYGVDVHLPSWPQQLLWVMHHLSATLSTVLAAWVFSAPQRDPTLRPGWRHAVVPGLLLVHALFSSAFVVIGALPLGLAFVAWRAVCGSCAGVVLVSLSDLLTPPPPYCAILGKEALHCAVLM